MLLSTGLKEQSLVAQLVKNLPTMQENWVRFLGWEDPLEKGMATHSSILAWPVHILNHLISTNYLGSTVNNKGSLILGNSKAYEVTSQELGPKTHQILH